MSQQWINTKNLATQAAEILIYGEIGDWWDGLDAKTLADQIKAVESDTINVRILTYGGSLFTGLAIYNVLKTSGKQINIFNDGVIASAGTIIACAGNIFMPENALFMTHGASNLAYGNAQEMREAADLLDKFNESIKAVYRTKTGLDDEKLNELVTSDNWLSAQEAKNLGFVYEVTDGIEIAAKADNSGVILNSVSLGNLSSKKLPQQFLNNSVKSNDTTEKGEEPMDLATLKAKHPDTYAQAAAEGKNSVDVSEAVKAERARIAEINAMVLLGQEALAAKAIEDGLSAGEFAIQAMKETKEKGANFIENRKTETEPLSNVPAAAPAALDPQAEADKAEMDEMIALAKKARGEK